MAGQEDSHFDDGYSVGETLLSRGETTVLSGDESIPDIQLLNLLCARAQAPKGTTEAARAQAEKSWEPVRDWLASHNLEEVRAAAEQRGESAMTALHCACKNVPPLDVIDVFLSVAVDTVRWPDSFEWLPLHYACACGAETDVIKLLAEAYPESKTTVDRRRRTPLHFALGNANPDTPASPDVVSLLSSSGAAKYADDNGMLPLHYACAYGAPEEILYVLTDTYPEAITTKDINERTPLHFALSNAGRRAAPSAVRLLLSLNRDIVNSIDEGPLPLRVLAGYAATVKDDDETRDSVHRCLEHLLNAEPDPTADFLTALQSLPDWLSERAVVVPIVQNLLNEKISQRFPTAVLMLDFYVLTMIIISYSMNFVDSIRKRTDEDKDNNAIDFVNLIPLYLGAAYFTLREVIQMISLLSLKSFNIWLYNPGNWLNVTFVFLVLYWTSQMAAGTGGIDHFRIGAAISSTILWLKLLAYLRNMLIDFAVFVGGLGYVVQRLAAFLMALTIILIAFAQMFYTIFQQTEYCNSQPYNSLELLEEVFDGIRGNRTFESLNITREGIIRDDTRCSENNLRQYCNFWDSFLSVYTMLLGEVDESDFMNSPVATAFFIIFMFLVVILLANVLIAIVTDSYKVIQDQRAAIVFWTNRLDFVAEMDAVANGPWKSRMKQFVGLGGTDSSRINSRSRAVFGKELWKQIMDLFEDDVDEGVLSFDFIAYVFLRVFAAFFIIPVWFLLGIFTAGWLWPPQLREAVFTSTVFKHSSDTEKEDDLRKTQVKQLQHEVSALKDELVQELALDRTQVIQIKSQVAERKQEIANEMKHIKRIVEVLFERQAG